MSNTDDTLASAADIEAAEPVYFLPATAGDHAAHEESAAESVPVFYLAPSFYHPAFCPQIPAGAKVITEARWMELRGLNAQGYTIEPDAEGYPIAAAPPPPTLEQRKAALLAAVDRVLNAAAQKKGYDSITTASLRAAYPGPFHAEGVAFASWMDGCYAKCYEVLAKVEQAQMPEPNEAELLAILPVLQLP